MVIGPFCASDSLMLSNEFARWLRLSAISSEQQQQLFCFGCLGLIFLSICFLSVATDFSIFCMFLIKIVASGMSCSNMVQVHGAAVIYVHLFDNLLNCIVSNKRFVDGSYFCRLSVMPCVFTCSSCNRSSNC